jgi:hypothetical protein
MDLCLRKYGGLLSDSSTDSAGGYRSTFLLLTRRTKWFRRTAPVKIETWFSSLTAICRGTSGPEDSWSLAQVWTRRDKYDAAEVKTQFRDVDTTCGESYVLTSLLKLLIHPVIHQRGYMLSSSTTYITNFDFITSNFVSLGIVTWIRWSRFDLHYVSIYVSFGIVTWICGFCCDSTLRFWFTLRVSIYVCL